MRLLLDTHIFLWYITADKQAIEHDLHVVTVDSIISKYPVKLLPSV